MYWQQAYRILSNAVDPTLYALLYYTVFLQGITIELTKIFLTRDIETDQEAFRLLLKKYFMAEKK